MEDKTKIILCGFTHINSNLFSNKKLKNKNMALMNSETFFGKAMYKTIFCSAEVKQ